MYNKKTETGARSEGGNQKVKKRRSVKTHTNSRKTDGRAKRFLHNAIPRNVSLSIQSWQVRMLLSSNERKVMSRSKYGKSNLYMTPREFADLVIKSIEEQNYFGEDEVAHPEDIANAFSTVGCTIGTAMSWAISEEHRTPVVSEKKNAVMQTGDLRKNLSNEGEKGLDSLGYSEWKRRGYL